MQPYAIALYTAKGVQMLWQGQEFAENWTMPDGTDPRRTLFSRPLHYAILTRNPVALPGRQAHSAAARLR
jgi:1,4-alpha-glucan branching enzyme